MEDQADFAEQLAARHEVLGAHPDVLVRAPESAEAERELLTHLFTRLPRDLPQHYSKTASGLRVRPTGETWSFEAAADDPLGAIARWVPDDFCFMHADPSGTYRLRSAVVCFPTRWQLQAKLGRGLTPIHAPVPGYQQDLGKGVEQVFDRLTINRPMWRINWSLVDAPDLYQPIRPAGDEILAHGAERIGQEFWLRTERQSIVRLESSQAVVFGIRIRQERLDVACAADPDLAGRMLTQVDSMPAALKRYKGLARIETPLQAYLRTLCV